MKQVSSSITYLIIGVGKSSIITSFIDKTFKDERGSTSGATYISKEVMIDDIEMKFNIWDTAGQEKFRSLTRMFYKDATVAILVYDITQENSFKAIKQYWIHQITESSPKSVIIVIAGNKSDLMEDEKVSENEVRKFSAKLGAMYQSISAKNRKGIEELFLNIGYKYLNPSWIKDKEAVEEYNRLKEIKRSSVKIKQNGNDDNIKSFEKKKKKKWKCCE